MVNTECLSVQKAEQSLGRLFADLGGGGVQTHRQVLRADVGYDAIFRLTVGETEFTLVLEIKARITPQTALSVCEQMRKLPDDRIPVVYAPVISPRVAEILDQHGIGHFDQAGNCRITSVRHRLFLDRHGYKSPSRPPKGIVDLFAPKSSRVVRALLSQPAKGWRVRELATHPDVAVSMGLAAKVKQTLIEEGYAIEHDRRLYPRDPVGLLENWAKKYAGPAEQIPLFFRGSTEEAEQAVADWCRDNGIAFALAGFSAGWRLAPEVRYGIGAVYVENRGFDRGAFSRLSSYRGGKPVETGANLLLWRPYDPSALVGVGGESETELPVASAIQTYLDLKRLGGRGEEAATAIHAKLLARPFKEASRQIGEMRHGRS